MRDILLALVQRHMMIYFFGRLFFFTWDEYLETAVNHEKRTHLHCRYIEYLFVLGAMICG